MVQEEIRRVKKLPDNGNGITLWKVSTRPKDKSLYWERDPVDRLPGVGAKTAEKLVSNGINKIGDIASLQNDANISSVAAAVGILNDKLNSLIQKAARAEVGN